MHVLYTVRYSHIQFNNRLFKIYPWCDNAKAVPACDDGDGDDDDNDDGNIVVFVRIAHTAIVFISLPCIAAMGCTPNFKHIIAHTLSDRYKWEV